MVGLSLRLLCACIAGPSAFAEVDDTAILLQRKEPPRKQEEEPKLREAPPLASKRQDHLSKQMELQLKAPLAKQEQHPTKQRGAPPQPRRVERHLTDALSPLSRKFQLPPLNVSAVVHSINVKAMIRENSEKVKGFYNKRKGEITQKLLEAKERTLKAWEGVQKKIDKLERKNKQKQRLLSQFLPH